VAAPFQADPPRLISPLIYLAGEVTICCWSIRRTMDALAVLAQVEA
jgi:hypothetical protein